jgi:mannose-1-phosphate guanylyltransferase/phosphomannomutase
MKAVVMAGGEGSRLRPLTLVRPKPMLPVVNRPLLGHILYLLRQHGITQVVMTLQYMAAQIQDYFGDGKTLEMEIEYVVEESPLGTAGSVIHALPHLDRDKPFLVISGDALTDFDLTTLVDYHRRRGALLTMALHAVPDPLEYGVVVLGEGGRIDQFLEKPSWGKVTSDTVNTGIYVVEPAALANIPGDQPVDWSQDVFPQLLAQGAGLHGYVAHGYWCDIGTLSEYRRANADLLNGRLRLGELGQHIGGGIWTGGGEEIAPDAQLFGPIYLGEAVKIKGGVIVQGPAVIRDYSIVDSRARVDRSILWRNCYVGEGAAIHGAVIGRQCSIRARAQIFEGVIVGDGTVVGEDAVIQPAVKVWPSKEVEAGATVTHSIIWGSQGRRVLFSRYGVTGSVNIDLTPDLAARLGAAFASTLPRGSTVTINRDPHRSPRMIKRAILSGIPSAGNDVLDLQQVPIPVARYYTRAIGAAGGVHVRLSPYDQRVVDIRFIDRTGLNLTREQERAVERIFFREDYRRAYMESIGNIDYATDVVEVYERGYLAALNAAAVRAARFRLVVDYAHAPSAAVLPRLLDSLNVEAVPLNARIDPNRVSISQEEFRAERNQLAKIAGALDGIHLGVRLDVGGEKIFLVDDTAVSLSDPVVCAAMAALVFQTYPGAAIVVTADQSQVFERLAARYGGRVQRCPVDAQALMAAAAAGNVLMAGDGTGNLVFPALHPVIDGLFAVGRLLELLALREIQLAAVAAQLPPFHVHTLQVNGGWDTKGRVMRRVHERFEHLPHEILDGIKICPNDEAWALVRPDPDRPLFHVVAEAATAEAAQQLAQEFAEHVQQSQ